MACRSRPGDWRRAAVHGILLHSASDGGAGFALAAVGPPGTGRRTVGEVDDGSERVEHTRVLTAPVEVAQGLKKLLGFATTEILRPLDAESQQHLGDLRPDVG